MRKYRTPIPDKEVSEDETRSIGLFLLKIINRQWKLNKKIIEKLIGQTGNQEPILKEMV